MVLVGAMIAIALLVFILSPFWLGPGGLLVPSSMIVDRQHIKKLKQIILERYVKDEKAAEQGDITKSEWRRRQQFLTNRYIDLARRYDYLNHMEMLRQSSGKVPEPQGNKG